jgi:hypothetical protein
MTRLDFLEGAILHFPYAPWWAVVRSGASLPQLSRSPALLTSGEDGA